MAIVADSSGNSLIDATYSYSGITEFEPGLHFNAPKDGVTDASDAFNRCISYAQTYNHRYILVEYPYYVPNLNQSIGDLLCFSRTRNGRIIGASVRKEVIAMDAPYPPPPKNTLRARNLPAVLSTAAGTGTIIACLVGDSVSTPHVTAMSMHATLNAKIQEALRRDNRNVTIEWHNRGIGGQTWETLGGVATSAASIPWYTVPTDPWLNYVEALSPDLLVISFARNGGSLFQLKHIRDVMTIINGWAKVPAIIVSNSLGETQTEVTGTTAALNRNGFEHAASGIKSFALSSDVPIGLLDFAAYESMMRFGYSPDDLPMLRDPDIIGGSLQSTSYNFDLPWTCPVQVYGWGGRFRIDPGQWTTLGNEFSITIGNAMNAGANGCKLWISRDTGTNEISYRITASLTVDGGSENWEFVPLTATGVFCTDAEFFAFAFEQKGSYIYVGYLLPGSSPATPTTLANQWHVMYAGHVPRCGGLYRPIIRCAAGTVTTGGLEIIVGPDLSSIVLSQRPTIDCTFKPQIVDREYASPNVTPKLAWGGDGPHPGALAAELIIDPVIAANDFSAT